MSNRDEKLCPPNGVAQVLSKDAPLDEGSWSTAASEQLESVLLQRAPTRFQSGRSLLFRRAEHTIQAWEPKDVPLAFAEVERRLKEGFCLAGYVAYEVGFALEDSLTDLAFPSAYQEPLLWFGCYREPEERQETFPPAPIPSRSRVMISPRYSLDRESYRQRVEAVCNLIAKGETYQLNLTMDAAWKTEEAPARLYERWLQVQPVPYATLLHALPDWHIVSMSPELFLRRSGDRLETRPMKGTASPGRDAAETRAQAEWLRSSEKDRAENVMIVDLLRNDLNRICTPGSVRVPRLFEVERYPTVLQMVSTVEGRLLPGLDYFSIFKALFPSGSIVGAPKIHSMRLLRDLEARQRGVYTGAIGYITPQGEAEFSVGIRTASIANGNVHFGVGSGITFDSDPAKEYAECLVKTGFVHREPDPPFDLFETLLLEEGRYVLLEEHLDRIAQSAEHFSFRFDEVQARKELNGVVRSAQQGERLRVRLVLKRDGGVSCTSNALPAETTNAVDVLLWHEPTVANDRLLRHKTTHRTLYDGALARARELGFADSLFQKHEAGGD